MTLQDYLNVEDIELNYPASDYREAIQEAGKILLKKGAIREEYIDAMISTCDELGAYIVLVPGVAVPHAAPEAGALKVGLSIVQLKEPICFHHPENDPVRLLIGLSSPDNQSHLSALQFLSKILMNKDLMSKTIEATDNKELYELLKNNLETEKE